MNNQFIILILFLFFAFSNCTNRKNNNESKSYHSYEFINGFLFNGESFDDKTFYVINGQFSDSKLNSVDTIVNLNGMFLIPPFGEAHNHNIESLYNFETQKQIYLRKGVFYVKIPNNIAQLAKKLKSHINKPESIDVVFANGGITSSGGHPSQLYKMLQNQGVYPSDMKMETQAYYYVDNEADLEQKWPLILKDQPDFIKTFLLYTNNNSVDLDAWQKGLNPNLLPLVVSKAHEEGLPVTTHVETSSDFHYAVMSGVDEINHLPGYNIPENMDSTLYLIDKSDAELAFNNNINVVTTLLFSKEAEQWAKPLEYMRSVQIQNLKVLKESGVKLAAGSDTHHSTVFEELLLLESLDVFSPLELLKIACENSATVIFPKRKIGKLENGYEASFLILKKNPLEDFKNIRSIQSRFKQGQFLK